MRTICLSEFFFFFFFFSRGLGCLPAPGSIVPYIELSIYRGWQEVTGKQPLLLIGAIFFDAVKTYC